MVHFCILSNHEGVLAPGRRLYVTLLGSLNLRRPPTAALVAEARRGGGAGQVRPEGLLVTILGGTTLLWPTLAEEYQALADGLASGAYTLADWDRYVGGVGSEGPPRIASFTLFGELKVSAVPTEDAELEALAMQRHLGRIDQGVIDRLMIGVGQGGIHRLAAVRQAVAAMLP